ncbi:MAG: glycine--tRNA ligase subunit beta [Planctomycetota bacterium]
MRRPGADAHRVPRRGGARCTQGRDNHHRHTPTTRVVRPGLPERQPDTVDVRRGPAVKAAYDAQGNPTKALQGFSRGAGIDPSEVETVDTPKGQYVQARIEVPGRSMMELLEELLPQVIAKVPFPKSMHWVGTGTTFARPVRNLLALLGTEVVPVGFAGVESGRTTPGHPFLSQGVVELAEADYRAYVDGLKEKHVYIELDRRRQVIAERIRDRAGVDVTGRYDRLLDEVTNLVEYPNVVVGTFDEAYLDLPDEVLVASMTGHQRYFPVHAEDGSLTNRFISVSNRDDASAEIIRQGNQRVLRARLSDALFFYNEDRKTPLADRLPELDHVTFQAELGSYGQKVARVKHLAEAIARQLDLSSEDTGRAACAAQLCKSDLVTHMVGEFAELQGTMGRLYAEAEGLDPVVARALEEHYYPRSAAGELPTGAVGAAVSIADKLDTMVGCFAVGLAPTGSRDPYMLRRFALGIARMALEMELSFSLRGALDEAAAPLARQLKRDGMPVDEVTAFFRDRLYQSLRDQGYPHDLTTAVLAVTHDDILDLGHRLGALARIAEGDNWTMLVESVQRTANITAELDEPAEINPDLVSEPAEQALYDAWVEAAPVVAGHIEARRYEEAARTYCDVFAHTLHTFFEDVFVNVDDPALRTNRLSLLKRINLLFADRFADLSKV